MRTMERLMAVAALGALLGSGAVGCGAYRDIQEAIEGDYHHISPATGGVYLTIKRHASNDMIAFFNFCKNDGAADATCGTRVLRTARDIMADKLHGRALELWNGDYSVFGYHPDLGKGFRDDEGGDFATAVRDLKTRGDECLRVHWKPSGTNWTTVDDEGVAECEWGVDPTP